MLDHPLKIASVLAGIDWSNALAGAGFVVAVLASILALRHLREIRIVQRHIDSAQQRTQENVEATVDLQKKIEENVEKTEILRKQTLAALELHEIVVKDETLSYWVRDVSAHFVQIKAAGDPLMAHLARRDLLKSGDFMGMGSCGHITIRADAFHHAEALANILLETTDKGDEFWASSLVHAAFWEGANSYLRQQREKIEQGVKIKRVFVFDKCDAFRSHHAQEQMTRQHDASITVKYDIPSPFDARDLAVVLKKTASGALVPTYAMECKLGRGKRIDHVELWYANELQSETVTTAWRDLEEFFENATEFSPGGAGNSAHPANVLLAREAAAATPDAQVGTSDVGSKA